MQPSDSLASVGRSSGSPRPRPTSWGRRLFCRLRRRPVRAPADAPAWEITSRRSIQPGSPEEKQGPPGLRGRPLRACRDATPRRTRSLLAPTSLREDLRRERYCLREKQNARQPECIIFGATYPRPTRSRAYASPTSLPRPSQGSLPARAGSPLVGRISHPLDYESKFHGVIAIPPIPIDQQSLVALNFLSAAVRCRRRGYDRAS